MSDAIVHGGGVTAAAALYGGRPDDWLDLSTGINPCPAVLPDIPARVWQRLPDQHLLDTARAAAADYYRSGDCKPLPVPGTQSVIQLLPRLVAPGRRVAIFAPTYGEYARVLSKAGFAVDLIDSPDQLCASHGLAVLVNPNNPTGRALLPVEVERIRAAMRGHGGLLLVDEAFGDPHPDLSVVSPDRDYEGLVVFRSFGKFFGLAGLRLGFVIAAEPVLKDFAHALGPWAVSGPALAIAADLMRGNHHPIRVQIEQRASALNAVLAHARMEIVGGTALFTLVRHDRAADLHAALCRDHILTRRFDDRPHWLRIGLAPDTAGDQRFAAALQRSVS